MDLDRGIGGSLWIILVGYWRSEEGQQSISHQAGDRTPIFFNHLAHRPQAAAEDQPGSLGFEFRSKRG